MFRTWVQSLVMCWELWTCCTSTSQQLAPAAKACSCELLTALPFSGAVDDFTIAVEQAPFFADGWKRRGQARSALGQNQEALEVY